MHATAPRSINQQSLYSARPLHSCGRRTRAQAAANATEQQRASHLQQLSTILLVNENLKRRLGRRIIDYGQLQNATEIVDQADYALLVIARHRTASSAPLTGQQSSYPVVFANAAAASLLCQQQQDHQQQQHLQLPAELDAAVQQPWAPMRQGQQQQGQLQQQQQAHQCPCSLLEGVTVNANDDSIVSLERVLAVPVHAPNDEYVGLAIMFDRWRYPADGSLGAPKYLRVQPSQLPTPEVLQQAADAVRQQADAVRELKQGHGLSNKDPQVSEAVHDLQQLKQQLAWLESLQTAFQSPRQSILDDLLQGSRDPAGELFQHVV